MHTRKSRRTRPVSLQSLEPRTLLSVSYGVFDEAYYLAHNPDVKAAVQAGALPSGLAHFASQGLIEGRAPSAYFDPTYYLVTNPDVAAVIASGGLHSAVEHFVIAGDSEGRNPIPEFSNSFYLRMNPDVAAAVGAHIVPSAFDHFKGSGEAEGRAPSAVFDAQWYMQQYPDVRTAVANGTFSSPLVQFIQAGETAGRQPSPFFDPAFYRLMNPDVDQAVSNQSIRSAFLHYRASGFSQLRLGSTKAYTVDTLEAVSPANQLTVVGSYDGGSVTVLTDPVHFVTYIRHPSGAIVPVPNFVAVAVSSAGVAGRSPANRGLYLNRAGAVVDIGNLSDGTANVTNGTFPTAINARGQITGGSYVFENGANHLHPFLWTPGAAIRDLGLPGITPQNLASDAQGAVINDAGVVIATTNNLNVQANTYASFAYTPTGNSFALQLISQGHNDAVFAVSMFGQTQVILKGGEVRTLQGGFIGQATVDYPKPVTLHLEKINEANPFALVVGTLLDTNNLPAGAYLFSGGRGYSLNAVFDNTLFPGLSILDALHFDPTNNIYVLASPTNGSDLLLLRLRPTVQE